MPNICFMNTIRQMCQLTASQSVCVTTNKKKKGEPNVLFALFSLCFQVGAMCCMLFATARTQRPVLHAANILINLEDDSMTG